jgi:enediyne biosynthesis protein E3
VTIPGKLRRSLLGVSRKEATAFSEGNSETWKQLEAAVLAAIDGYHATLESSKFEKLIPQLDKVALEMRGYAYEGAAIGLTAFDCVMPWKKSLQEYMAGPAAAHIYMVHIGAGEALARLRRKPEPFIARLKDRTLCWLVMDGYGFHEGFFARKRYIDGKVVPTHLSPYARRIFDQGLGRSIWFLAGAQVERIAATLAVFPTSRQADLWVGIGVACAYVGGIDRAAIEALQKAAGPYRPHMGLGTAFVAKGRQRAGNPVSHTDRACRVLWGLSSEQAAQIVDKGFEDLPADGPEPGYEILQQRILGYFAETTAIVSQPKEAAQ